MCGILVWITKSNDTQQLDSFDENLNTLKHRGPDYMGKHICTTENQTITFGHTRLAIVKPNGSQSQPFVGSNYILSINGEIYNYKSILCNEKSLMEDSDCVAVIPVMTHAINKRMEITEEVFSKDITVAIIGRAVDSLDGIFAFVFYHSSSNKLIVARDAIGVIPLYYAQCERTGSVYFSSELKAFPKDDLIVKEFPPGCLHYGDLSDIHISPIDWYKTLHPYIFPTNSMPKLYKAIVYYILESVRKRMMTDVPFGVLLSGGLDSSIIAACVCSLRQKRIEEEDSKAWYPQIHSFAIGLKDSPDLVNARICAKFLDTVHHEIIVTEDEVTAALEDAVYYLETYDTASIRSGVIMMIMAKNIQKMGIKMVLGGDGADELFAGYAYFKYAPNAEELYNECSIKLDELSKYDCLRGNKAMMAGSIEYRVPFLDKSLIDFIHNHIHPEYRLQSNRCEKYILRKAFEGWLPEDILWRKKVQFSAGAGDNMIRSIIKYCSEIVSDEDFSQRSRKFPLNTPLTKEAYFYRQVFAKHFPGDSYANTVSYYPSMNCSSEKARMWLPEELQNKMDPCGEEFAN